MSVLSHRRFSRRRRGAIYAGVILLSSALAGMVATHARATAGCVVDYTISSQWSGGFGVNVSVKNLGDPVSGWTLTWSFGAGQQVTQAWNAAVTQSGSNVTAKSASYNGSLGTGGSTSFGFNGSLERQRPGARRTSSSTAPPVPGARRAAARRRPRLRAAARCPAASRGVPAAR